MTRVVVVGDVMVDVITRLDGPIARGSDAPAQISFGGGGSAANVAAWLPPAPPRGWSAAWGTTLAVVRPVPRCWAPEWTRGW
jgi:sugar/nucleoside kinase (ribokinase family)